MKNFSNCKNFLKFLLNLCFSCNNTNRRLSVMDFKKKDIPQTLLFRRIFKEYLNTTNVSFELQVVH